MVRVHQRFIHRLVMSSLLIWLVNGENYTDANLSSSDFPSRMTDFPSRSFENLNEMESIAATLPTLDFEDLQTSFWTASSESDSFSKATDFSYFNALDLSFNTLLLSSVPEYNTFLKNEISEAFDNLDISDYVADNSNLIYFTASIDVSRFPILSTPPVLLESSSEEYDGYITSNISINFPDVTAKTTIDTIEGSTSHFRTPLMSLLFASSSLPFELEKPDETRIYFSSVLPTSSLTSDNESTTTELATVPTDSDHKKLLMLVLRAEDCSKLSKADFEKMLAKLMAKFGFGEVVPQVSNAQCYSHLHINLTLGDAAPTLRFLPNMDGKDNITVDVLNRTFRVVKVEKIDIKLEKTHQSFNTSSNIAKVVIYESVTYIVVGLCFGISFVLGVIACCVKCCLRDSKKRYLSGAKCTHMRLRPEDYTLTPMPRPNSLYVDYYRGSAAGDIYANTSAGSVRSTPIGEKGVIQSFDTSIVPLEDSGGVAFDISRDPSIESVRSDMKTFHIQGSAAKGLRNAAADSKERLNPKHNSSNKTKGFANPTFQRY